MRSASLFLGLAFTVSLLSACAQQHGYRDDERAPGFVGGNNPGATPARPPSVTPGFPGPDVLDPGLFGGPLPEAAIPWPFDASTPTPPDDNWPFWDGGVLDGGLTVPDGGYPLPAWRDHGKAASVNVSGPCPSAPPGRTSGPSCRASGWQSPACYRTPIDCPALAERDYCLIGERNEYGFLGAESGIFCAANVQLPFELSSSIGRLGGDLYTCHDGVPLQLSLTDGSFDTAPVPCSSVFTADGAVYVHLKGASAVYRFESWAQLKRREGKVIGHASSDAVFGSSRVLLVAMWQDLEQVDILSVDGSRSFRMYAHGLTGRLRGVSLSEDNRLLFALTDDGLWTVSIPSGQVLSRTRTPLHGALSCAPGLAQVPAPANALGNPRPGIALTSDSQLILRTDSCDGKQLREPQYIADDGGPELLVLSSAGGAATIEDTRSTPHTLVLHADAATQWSVRSAANTKLERIILHGPVESSLVVNDAAPVERLFGERSLGSLGEAWFTGPGSLLRGRLQDYAGRAITELRGCLGASASYTIGDAAPLCKR